MSISIIVRSILVSILIAVPAPFLISWLATASEMQPNVVMFASVYVLAFVGCLVMGFCGTRDSNRQRGERSGQPRQSGTVKWFNVSKGFGFITLGNGEDVFVHYRSIKGAGHKSLREGQKVEFVLTEGEKGMQADDVCVAK